MKVLILLPYYDRPRLVKGALESVLHSEYTNWHVVFVDDGSKIEGEPIVLQTMGGFLDSVTLYRLDDSQTEKEEQGGSRMGQVMNEAMLASDAEIAIFLCDDDRLIPDYLGNLVRWFEEHPDEAYAFSHIHTFDPTVGEPEGHTNADCGQCVTRSYNRDRGPRAVPNGGLDASQLAWRLTCIKEGVHLPSPRTLALDGELWWALFRKYGGCLYTGFYSQYKSVFPDMLGERKKQGKIYEISVP